MPLSDLDKRYSIIHIAGREYRVRYSLNALLCLENCYKPIEEILKTPAKEWNIEDVLQLVRAALCDLPRNKKAVIRRDWEHIQPDIAELGKEIDAKDFIALKNEIVDALINSFPKPVIGDENDSDEIGYKAMRSMYCDIIGRPEKEFWTSNLKEIKERTESYLEVKGLKEPPKKVKMYEE